MVSIQQEGFDIQSEVKKIKPSDESGIGALVTFVGYVRDFKDNKSDTLTSMEIEFYPGMTEKALLEIEEKARKAWDVFDVNIIHRFGKLNLNDQIVLVAVTSAHRTEAFRACEFIIDFLKTDAPFWKKEIGVKSESWVDANIKDYEKINKWYKSMMLEQKDSEINLIEEGPVANNKSINPCTPSQNFFTGQENLLSEIEIAAS